MSRFFSIVFLFESSMKYTDDKRTTKGTLSIDLLLKILLLAFSGRYHAICWLWGGFDTFEVGFPAVLYCRCRFYFWDKIIANFIVSNRDLVSPHLKYVAEENTNQIFNWDITISKISNNMRINTITVSISINSPSLASWITISLLTPLLRTGEHHPSVTRFQLVNPVTPYTPSLLFLDFYFTLLRVTFSSNATQPYWWWH